MRDPQPEPERAAPVAHGPEPEPRLRGRPRGFDRDVALAAAIELFARKGFAATSVAELTTAMGIAAPSLYAAFGSKEALYAEALGAYAGQAQPLLFGPLEEAATARDGIAAFLAAAARCLPGRDGAPGGCMIALSSAGQEGCGDLGALVETARAEARRLIAARLERGAAAGEMRPSTDLAALAAYVVAVQGGMAIQARDGATETDLAAIARLAMAGVDAALTWDAQPPGSAPGSGRPKYSVPGSGLSQ